MFVPAAVYDKPINAEAVVTPTFILLVFKLLIVLPIQVILLPTVKPIPTICVDAATAGKFTKPATVLFETEFPPPALIEAIPETAAIKLALKLPVYELAFEIPLMVLFEIILVPAVVKIP